MREMHLSKLSLGPLSSTKEKASMADMEVCYTDSCG